MRKKKKRTKKGKGHRSVSKPAFSFSALTSLHRNFHKIKATVFAMHYRRIRCLLVDVFFSYCTGAQRHGDFIRTIIHDEYDLVLCSHRFWSILRVNMISR